MSRRLRMAWQRSWYRLMADFRFLFLLCEWVLPKPGLVITLEGELNYEQSMERNRICNEVVNVPLISNGTKEATYHEPN